MPPRASRRSLAGGLAAVLAVGCISSAAAADVLATTHAASAAARAADKVTATARFGLVQAHARSVLGAAGLDDTQLGCFSDIVRNESDWNHASGVVARTDASGAGPRLTTVPAVSTGTAIDGDWRHNPAVQVKWALDYMTSRYGSPCGAWDFWQANHWY